MTPTPVAVEFGDGKQDNSDTTVEDFLDHLVKTLKWSASGTLRMDEKHVNGICVVTSRIIEKQKTIDRACFFGGHALIMF